MSQVNAARQHRVEEAIEGLAIALHDLRERRRCGRAKEKAEHSAGVGGAERHAGGARLALQAGGEARGRFAQALEESRAQHLLERFQAGAYGDRIAGQRARLVHRSHRRQLLHDVAPPAEGAHRHAAADHLAERGEIRCHAEEALGAARRDAISGHHLVEDQHGAVLRAKAAQHADEFIRRADEIHVAGDRLEHHRGDLVAVAREGIGNVLRIVVVEHERVRRQLRRHARRSRVAEGERAGAGLHQQEIAVAVIATLELDDDRAARESARQPERAHHRLRARAHQPYLLE